jgi:hypothetical protein
MRINMVLSKHSARMIMFGFAGRPKSFIRKPYEAEKNTASHRNSQDDSITMTIT